MIEKPVEEFTDGEQAAAGSMSAAVILKNNPLEGWGSAFDFEGSPFVSLGDGLYQFKVVGDSNQSLLEKLTSWKFINTVKLVSSLLNDEG